MTGDFYEGRSMPDNLGSSEEVSRGLNFDDLIWINQQSWGLRHVSDRQQAIGEYQRGVVNGDALALAAITNLITADDYIKDVPDEFRPILKHLPLNILSNYLDESKKPVISARYDKSVRQFLGDSLGIGINQLAGKDNRVGAMLEKVVNQGSTFLVGEFQGSEMSYDESAYYGLGKCGKQSVAPEKILRIIMPENNDVAELRSQLGDNTEVDNNNFNLLKSELTDRMMLKFESLVKERKTSRGQGISK